MFARMRMHMLLGRLNRLWREYGDDVISGDRFDDLRLSPKQLDALEMLEEVEVIELDRGDERIIGVAKGKKRWTYILERSELWFNRMMSFFAGIGTALIIEFLTYVLFRLINAM